MFISNINFGGTYSVVHGVQQGAVGEVDAHRLGIVAIHVEESCKNE
jgi:hypothetical protein